LELTSLAFYFVIGIIGIVIASKIIKLLRNGPARKIYQGINPNARLQSFQHSISRAVNSSLPRDFDIGRWGSQIQNAWEKAGSENERFVKNLFGPDKRQNELTGDNREHEEFESLGNTNDAAWERTLDENTEYAKRILGLNRDKDIQRIIGHNKEKYTKRVLGLNKNESENDYEDPWDKTVQENSKIAKKIFQEPEYLEDDYDDYERPKKTQSRAKNREKRSKKVRVEELDYEDPWVKASREDAKIARRMLGLDDEDD